MQLLAVLARCVTCPDYGMTAHNGITGEGLREGCAMDGQHVVKCVIVMAPRNICDHLENSLHSYIHEVQEASVQASVRCMSSMS